MLLAVRTLVFVMPASGSGLNSPALSEAWEAGVDDLPIPPLYQDPGLFLPAIRIAEACAQPPEQVTGIIVPHHLLAIDLMARVFRIAGRFMPRRIILLAPDHFRRSRNPFAVCGRDMETCMGKVPAAKRAAMALARGRLVGVSSLFSHEHGVQAVLPFIAHHFPGTPVLAIAISTTATPSAWKRLWKLLEPLSGPGTLVIQSTDFSHGFDWERARKKDQESLRVICSEDPAMTADLHQPAHVDSRGALFLQMMFQKAIGNHPTVIDNRNSQEYAPVGLTNSTSYISALYSRNDLGIVPKGTWMFAGDTFTGRFMATRLSQGVRGRALRAAAIGLTASRTVVLNLEGWISDCPGQPAGKQTPFRGSPPPALDLAMNGGTTIRLLKDLNVQTVILANNHSLDGGISGRSSTRRILEEHGITVVDRGETRDMGPFYLSALTDLDNFGPRKKALLSRFDLESLRRPPPGKPWFVFLHWGREWESHPGPREREIAGALRSRGVELVIGCHPHVSGSVHLEAGFAQIFSLGNFLFDQSGPRAGGCGLDLTFFRQGTYALKVRQFGNLYSAPGSLKTTGK